MTPKNPYPYRVMVTIVDSTHKHIGKSKYACFNTRKQAEAAQEAASMAAYELEPNDIEEND